MSKAKNLDLGKTSAVMLSAAESHRNEGINYFPKDGSHRYRFPSRKWTTSEKIFATILATGITLYGGHEIAKKNKLTKKYADSFDEFLGGTFSQIYNQIASLPGYGAHPPVVAPVVPAVNASVTPTITPQPNYDYYDKDFKVGIMIEGDSQFKQNVTNLLETFKQVTPDDYNDLIKYAPKKIVRSPDGYNWNGFSGSIENDFIELTKKTEESGGSDNLKTILEGVAGYYAEANSIKATKTNKSFSNITDRVIFESTGVANYRIKVGLWNEQQAENYLRQVSNQLQTGEFWNDSHSKPAN